MRKIAHFSYFCAYIGALVVGLVRGRSICKLVGLEALRLLFHGFPGEVIKVFPRRAWRYLLAVGSFVLLRGFYRFIHYGAYLVLYGALHRFADLFPDGGVELLVGRFDGIHGLIFQLDHAVEFLLYLLFRFCVVIHHKAEFISHGAHPFLQKTAECSAVLSLVF